MGTLTFDFRDFRKVRAEQAVSVDIVRSDTFSVTATADDISHVRVEKVGDTLKIGRRALGLLAFFRDRPRVTVAMPELDETVLSGAVHGEIVVGFDPLRLA